MEDLDNYQYQEEQVRRGGRRAIQSLNVIEILLAQMNQLEENTSYQSTLVRKKSGLLKQVKRKQVGEEDLWNVSKKTTCQHRTPDIMQGDSDWNEQTQHN